MPLFLLLTWLLARLGDSEVLLRLPSVVAGTLAVVAVYLLGRRLFGHRAGVVAALLTALVPFAVWYSQEARAYALFMLLTTIQMLLALTSVRRGRWFDWLGLAVFTSLNLYTHYLALAPTAAVAVYVGVFLAAGLLRRASRMTRAAVALLALVLAPAAALVHWRPVLRSAHSIAAQRPIIAVFVVALAVVFVAGAGWLLLRRLRPSRTAVRQLFSGLGCALLVALAYAPWLPFLRVFLNSPDQSVLRYDLNHAASLGEAAGVLAGLGVSGALLVLCALGLAAVVVWLFRGRAAEAALLVCWIGVSLLLLWLALRGAIVRIEVRYFAFLFPAAMLLLAAGVEAVSSGIAALAARFRVRISTPVVIAVVVAGLLLQVLPALAASYSVAKSDYRALATHIAATSAPGSIVLAIGDHPDYAVIGMTYYLRRFHAPVTVLDARLLNGDQAAGLAGLPGGGGGIAWGVAVLPSAGQRALLAQPEGTVTDFADVSGSLFGVRAAGRGLSLTNQVGTVLRWELPQEPELNAPLKLLDLLAGRAHTGPDLFPFVGSTEVLAGGGADYSAPVDPANSYALTFECRNPSLTGSLTVSATPVDGAGGPLVSYLGSGAYRCPDSAGWRPAILSLAVPRAAAGLLIHLRVAGGGSAEFRNLSLAAIEP